MRGAWALPLLLAGCQAAAVVPPRWEEASPEVVRAWQARRAATRTCAMLAAVEYQGPPRERSFTLELFYRAPHQYLLRGRGTLGVEGFRALVRGDSLVVLLDRQDRGFRGPAGELPARARQMWLLLREALPWVVGDLDLLENPPQLASARAGSRPERLQVERRGNRLELEYARYRDDYPYWHLRTVKGVSAEAEIRLEIRQQLYNPDLDSTLFELDLPAGTRPLLD